MKRSEIEKREASIFSKLEKDKNDAWIIVEKIKQTKKDIIIALEEINDGLRFIFYSADRLSIDLAGEEYVLKSRGKSVRELPVESSTKHILW